MAEQPPMIAPIAAPIFGSNGKPKLHFGSSITPSRVMNSCTRIVPMTSPSSGTPAAASDATGGRGQVTGPIAAQHDWVNAGQYRCPSGGSCQPARADGSRGRDLPAAAGRDHRGTDARG